MSKRKRGFTSAVGKKFLSAITGLALTVFLIGHLAGNLLLLRGKGESFNAYANFLNSIPILWIIELGLVALFGYHAYMGLKVYAENRKARPTEYYRKEWTKSERSRKSWGSTTMHFSGAAMLLLVVLHVWHFKFGHHYALPPSQAGTTALQKGAVASEENAGEDVQPGFVKSFFGGAGPRDLAQLVNDEFHKPYIVGLYVFFVLLTGLHLNHGFSSAFQSIGAGGLGKKLRLGGRIFTFLLTGGFLLIPIYVMFFRD